MRARGRDALIITLSAAAAGLDAWSFFGLGQVFVANMTGNTVLLGFSLFGGSGDKRVRALAALACYAMGAFAGALLARPIRRQLAGLHSEKTPHLKWPPRATLILSLECFLVFACATANFVLQPANGSAFASCLIATLAFAVGLQSSAINALQLPGISTTYITGTWTTLSSGFAQLIDREKQGDRRREWTTRLGLEAMVLVAYFGSAVACGLLDRCFGRAGLGFYPSALLLVVIAATTFGQKSRALPWNA